MSEDVEGEMSLRIRSAFVAGRAGRSRLARLSACLFASLLLALTLHAGDAAAQRRDLTIGITQYPSTLHPNIDAMAAKSYVENMTMRPFTTFDADWQLVCMLCVELPTFENGGAVRLPGQGKDGGDAVALTYRIQPDATWGDGTPVTTDDVLFTYDVGRHPQSGVSNAELYRDITKIEVVDAKTFVMTSRKLTFNYNAINDFRVLPAHLERPVFEADRANYRTRTLFDRDPTNPGLAFGPYRLTEVELGAFLVVEPNPHWWGEKPYFERIVVRVIENTAALEANLLSGGIDMIAGELGLSVDQAIGFEQRNGDRFRVVYKPGLVYEHLDVRLDNPILRDVRVRQALMHGMDRQALVDQLFGGRQTVARSDVNPLDWVHDDTTPVYGYDPAKAGALLDEAGWSTISRGIRQNAQGEPLRIPLVSTAGNRTRELIQQVLQAQWRQIGVDVAIEVQPPRVLFSESLTRRRFQGLALFAWIGSPENVPRTTLHSESIPTEGNGWAGQNYPGYASPDMDRLLDRIEVELDRERRKALWSDLQHLYAADLPALPLFFRSDVHIWPLWLEGVEPTGHQYSSTQTVERWRAADAG
ncbi:peptide ABC transporter substrate-binding protein [Marinivivus vitaminiproducens]|uniref:peptide ABC transporter substrate-binding protein n=1 Tax=Marinivivus vitaminiproducens TaxID=3035935 RepID=UPI00279AE8B2|nr:peptide ABC transporter substrate-binding protein [Geminicoccaceae bacterium SCSIO 64248]